MPTMNRRAFVAGICVFPIAHAGQALALAPTTVHVLKDPNCGCCGAWIGIMKREGFSVSVEDASWDDLYAYKIANGIPDQMTSCHTATVDGYVIEGHVPPEDIRRLLADRPDAIGLSVPGMPYGSPGMGPEGEREAYDVYLVHRDGRTQIFTSYPAA